MFGNIKRRLIPTILSMYIVHSTIQLSLIYSKRKGEDNEKPRRDMNSLLVYPQISIYFLISTNQMRFFMKALKSTK